MGEHSYAAFNVASRDRIAQPDPWKRTAMTFFNLFNRKHIGYASPWLQLTVVCAVAQDGMEPEHAFSLRGRVMAAVPIEFEFRDANAFIVYFPGSAEGLQSATHLAATLREYAREKSLSAFGAAVQQGECLAQLRSGGHFVAKPAGPIIGQTMRLALVQAAGDKA